MLTFFKWTLRGVVAVIVLGLITLALAYYVLSRSLPDYDEDFTLQGLTAPVEIVRNNNGVPHIFGANEPDIFYALGFAHAQDRLWQMTMLRRTAQGRLSELFGEPTVHIDELLRRLDLYEVSQASVAVQDARTTAVLEAYAAGVNAWIEEVNRGARGRGAPEFFLFSNEIAAWSPADSIAIIKLMALQLSAHLEAEVQRAQLSLILGPERLSDILPDDAGKGVATLDFAAVMPGIFSAPQSNRMAYIDAPLSPFKSGQLAGASNAWAASPEKSAAGGSLLANDPHLGLTAPSIWYLARLELPTGGVIGGTIPGMPAMLVGRSDNLGWGLTSSYMDDQDLVIEQLNPSNPEEYLTESGPKPFRTRQTILNVKDQTPITLTLRWSESGPILPGTHYDLASVTPEGHVAALQWTALSGSDTSMSAALKMMTSNSIPEAMAGVRDFIAPAQNLTLADKNGIAMITIGAFPARDPAHLTQGRLPAPGWHGTNRWTGMLPYESNPRFVDPVSGILGNTNNKTIDRPFPNHVSFVWGDTQRIQRWLTLMTAREVHTRDSFTEAQLDTVSPTARTLLPLIGAELWFTGEAAAEGTSERLRQRALALLAEWNGEMNEHLPEPLIAEAWLRALQRRLAKDELGPLSDQFTHPEPVFIERIYRNTAGASVWCDVIQSSEVETCPEIAQLALDEALVELVEAYGPNLESWRWGNAHQAAHDHTVLGDVPVLRHLVNIRQSTSGGDNTLLRAKTKGKGANPYLNVHAGAYRGVYDFSDPDSSIFILSTGQSGHPLSRFYDDQSTLWRRGEYLQMSLDPSLARAAAVGVTVLTPSAP